MKRRANATYEVTGNVIWVSLARRDRRTDRGHTRSALAGTLAKRVAQLGREIERSRELQCEIAAASTAQRYELFKFLAHSKERSWEWALASAQRAHLLSLLKFVRAIAAAQSVASRTALGTRSDPVEALAKSIRELQASLKRTRELTQGLLAQRPRQVPTESDAAAPLPQEPRAESGS